MSRDGAWYQQRERGSALGIRITIWVYRLLGRRLARLLLVFIVAYFYLNGRGERRASQAYLRRLYDLPEGREALGHEPRARDSYRHFYEFGANVLDRVGFWLGRPGDFEIEVHGMEHLDRVSSGGRGAVVLGSHLGSFDVMRVLAGERSPIAVNVLMYTVHAERINKLLRMLPGGETGAARIIQVQPGSFQHIMEVRSRVERGEVVAILADRFHPNEADRVARVDFLGGTARLPEGPILLAGVLGCPVLMMTALRSGPGRYDVFVEPFADPISLPRAGRSEAVREQAQRYADVLAGYVLRAPFQWFNFYDFWDAADGTQDD